MKLGTKVVVTTDKKGVFFGTLKKSTGTEVTLSDAKMCIYWSAATRGVLGLAATGPASGSKTTPAIPSIDLYGVASVMECSLEAAATWEAGRWT